MVGGPPMLLCNKASDKAPGFCSKVPNVFSSIEEARNSKDYQWNTCIHILNSLEPYGTYEEMKLIEPQVEVAPLAFSNAISRWLHAFNAFLQQKRNLLDKKELKAARALEISQIFCTIYLDVTPLKVFTSELGWDAFTARYKHMVELAALIMERTLRDYLVENAAPEFSLDMNIVAPMFAVAHRCRHPVIRRKAVSLLYAAPHQEGVWNSVLTARVAERLIDIEEGLDPITCAEDVPDWARLSGVDVKFDLYGRLGTVSYSRQYCSLDKIRETVIEVIQWQVK